MRQGDQPGAEGDVREEPPAVRGFARKKQSGEESGFRGFIVYRNNTVYSSSSQAAGSGTGGSVSSTVATARSNSTSVVPLLPDSLVYKTSRELQKTP